MGVKTILVSDLSGEELPEGTQPITLTYAETSVRLYLTDKEATALEKSLKKYLEAGEPAKAVKKAPKSDGVDKKAARAWLQANGYELGDRGRIPQSMIDDYLKAN